jgi:hypothetical protein
MAWYLTLLCLGIGAVLLAGLWLPLRETARMWRGGERLMAVTIATVCAVLGVLFGAIAVTALVALGPPVGNGT